MVLRLTKKKQSKFCIPIISMNTLFERMHIYVYKGIFKYYFIQTYDGRIANLWTPHHDRCWAQVSMSYLTQNRPVSVAFARGTICIQFRSPFGLTRCRRTSSLFVWPLRRTPLEYRIHKRQINEANSGGRIRTYNHHTYHTRFVAARIMH